MTPQVDKTQNICNDYSATSTGNINYAYVNSVPDNYYKDTLVLSTSKDGTTNNYFITIPKNVVSSAWDLQSNISGNNYYCQPSNNQVYNEIYITPDSCYYYSSGNQTNEQKEAMLRQTIELLNQQLQAISQDNTYVQTYDTTSTYDSTPETTDITTTPETTTDTYDYTSTIDTSYADDISDISTEITDTTTTTLQNQDPEYLEKLQRASSILHSSLTGIIRDRESVKKVLNTLTPEEKADLQVVYSQMYDQNNPTALRKDIKSNLVDNFGAITRREAIDSLNEGIGCNLEVAADAIHEAGNRLFSDDKTIKDVLESLTPEQRTQMEIIYNQKYGYGYPDALRDDIKHYIHSFSSEITDEHAIDLLNEGTSTSNISAAIALHNSMQGFYTDKNTILSIFDNKTPADIREISEIYDGLYSEKDENGNSTQYNLLRSDIKKKFFFDTANKHYLIDILTDAELNY